MSRIICVQFSALKRSCSLGKKNCVQQGGLSLVEKPRVSVAVVSERMNDSMPQQIQMFAFCLITVALTFVATLVCLNEKGKGNIKLSLITMPLHL